MNKLVKLGLSAASTAIFMSTFAVNAFAQTVDISGNGAGSDNTVVITNTCVQKVKQSNKTIVDADVTVKSNTGGNKIEGQTGGSSSITSGNITTDVVFDVSSGYNTINDLPDCCCGEDGHNALDVTISGNGVDTTNTVVETNSKEQKLKQKNKTKATLKATIKSKTGKNKIKNGTGTGADIVSGDVDTTVGGVVAGGGNTL